MKSNRSLMRVLICVIILMQTISFAYSQKIALNYYSTGTGQNITANYAQDLKKSEIGLGLGYTINSFEHPDNQGKIYYKRQFATEPLHHLNLNIFYHRFIIPNLDHISPFIFYDFQAKHSAARNVRNTAIDEVRYHGPYYWLDNTIGLGFNVNIIGKWYVQQKVGAGVHLIIPSGKEASMVEGSYTTTWEFIGLLNIGVVYKI